MRDKSQNTVARFFSSASGYFVVILAIAAFIIVLWATTFVVKLFMG